MLISTNSGLHSARLAKPRYNMIYEAMSFFAEAGFEAVDINFAASIYGDATGKKAHEPILDNPSDISKLNENILSLGLKVNTSHLPFFDYRKKDSPDYEHNQIMVFRSVDASSVLGAKWAVVHTSPLASDTIEYVRPLCEYANRIGVGLAIENSPRSTIEQLCEAIDTLKSEGYSVGCCYDTGHANFAGLNQAETLTQIGGNRLKMLHVHDNFGDRDAHKAPFAGNIKWEETMKALAAIDYIGDFNYEISASELPESARSSYAAYIMDLARWLTDIYNKERFLIGGEE